MTCNVVQLPYPLEGEIPSDYRLRLAFWKAERGWLVQPETLLSWDQRIAIEKRITETRPLPDSLPQ